MVSRVEAGCVVQCKYKFPGCSALIWKGFQFPGMKRFELLRAEVRPTFAMLVIHRGIQLVGGSLAS